VVSAGGGPERLVARYGRHPRFSPDGSHVAYWTGVEGDHALPSGKLWIVDVNGGTPRQLHPQLIDARFPAWSPDGRLILFRGSTTAGSRWDEMSDWFVTDVAGRTLTATGAFARLGAQRLSLHDGGVVWEGNRVVFSARAGHSTNLWTIEMSPQTGMAVGPPERLTSGSNLETSPWQISGGSVAYTNWEVSGQIWRVWTAGAKAGQAEAVTQTDALDTRPTVSRDGQRLIFTRRLGEARNLWFKDLTSGRESLIISGSPLVPTLGPDGREIAFSVSDGPRRKISIVPTTGGTPRTVCADCGDVQGWSATGTTLLYLRQSPDGQRTLATLDLETRKTRVLVANPEISEGHLSPDGRHLAITVREGGVASRIYVAPIPAEGPVKRESLRAVTPAGQWADKPRWSPDDGRTLYFYSARDGFGCIWQQPMSGGVPAGESVAVRHLHEARRAVLHLSRQAFGMSAGPDYVAYNVPNATGNLWMMTYEPAASGLARLLGWIPGTTH
jgi:Tol biopolymer transport system component